MTDPRSLTSTIPLTQLPPERPLWIRASLAFLVLFAIMFAAMWSASLLR
jgi:hypothetical protein